jgi:hypothetical protein
MVSNIRLIGIALGMAVLVAAFLYLRGQRWHRVTFVVSAVVGLGLLVVSLDPSAVDAVRDLLNLGQFEYGRLLALLIVSNVAMAMFGLYVKSKVDALKLLLDRSLRAAAADAVEPRDQLHERIKDVMIIIPALNEAENLEVLLGRIPRSICGYEVGVIVVDDGSTDGTKEVAIRHGCLVARSPVNRGQGAASRIGYSFLATHDVKFGLTMDADNQHRPEDIPKLLEPVISGQYDLVIGSRVLGSADRNGATRYAGVLLFSWLVSLLSGVRLSDCSSGFKAFDLARLARLDLREDQFQSSEVLITAAKHGLRIGEVPIHIHRRGHGVSRKGTNFTYGVLFLKTMAKTWWR